MSLGTIHVEGIGLWAPRLPGWELARGVLRAEVCAPLEPAPRPAPPLLAPAERRRAPDSVAVALEVAAAAVRMARRSPAELASVFVSAHGELAINDYMCRSLVSDPLSISPTKFHHSVHNAPAGYWSIATGSHQPSLSLSAWEHSFAVGLLEAATQCMVEARPVLLVGVDVQSVGALDGVTHSEGMLGAALVLSPTPGDRSVFGMELAVRTSGAKAQPSSRQPATASAFTDVVGANAMARALPLFETIARDDGAAICLALSAHLALHVQPMARSAA